MFGSNVLDVGIGLILIYLILGLVCSSVNEYIAQIFTLRAQFLWTAMIGMFKNADEGKAFVVRLYNHDLIAPLGNGQGDKSKLPSYIPSHLFSLALTDQIGIHESPNLAVGPSLSVVQVLEEANAPQGIKDALRPLAVAAGNDIDSFRTNIEAWYEAAMDRATGWYRRRVQSIIFCIAFAVVFASNADSLMLIDTLWSNPSQRASLAAQGTAVAASAKASTDPTAVAALPAKADPAIVEAQAGVSHLLGWSGPIDWRSKAYQPSDLHRFPAGAGWILKLVGLMITAFAASLGAPFWFGMLQKFVQVKNAAAPPSSTPPDVVRIQSQTFPAAASSETTDHPTPTDSAAASALPTPPDVEVEVESEPESEDDTTATTPSEGSSNEQNNV